MIRRVQDLERQLQQARCQLACFQSPIEPGSHAFQSSPPLDLPPRHVADPLLASFHDNFYSQFPALHWSRFKSEYDHLFQTRSLASLGNAWGAVFFCVLACGTLYTLDSSRIQDGRAFLTTAIGMTNRWQDEYSIEDARMAFLTSVFLTELNLKSAGWVWLGLAIRISQDIGLHVESGLWTTMEREMGRRLWYCIYAWDR